MSEGKVLKIALSLSLLFLFLPETRSQEKREPAARLMFYNTENFFDTYNDSLKEDDEFLPSGARRWTPGRYGKKLNSVFRTIVAAGEWDPPAMVALCEVENRKVLEDLVFRTNLSKYGYGIIHEDSPDPRGIDVCLIYRKEIFTVDKYRYLIPEGFTFNDFHSRSVLYAELSAFNDTLHFLVNHWPSRRGGVLNADGLRKQIAEMVRCKVDSILLRSAGRAKIIVMGDFNAAPDDKCLQILSEQNKGNASLYNLALTVKGSGTYRYLGTWEMIDQVLVTDWLFRCPAGFSVQPGTYRVFRPDFLLKNDPKYPGFSPFSTYSGYKYQGGYSDHLPVLLDLVFK